mmetsp:Transcript_11501/g.29118  ORF Transcript_11501/g.29118 Transcript_11501/m.29118 type:complete len:254 (+) Transcript_11501:657-1418(+)
MRGMRCGLERAGLPRLAQHHRADLGRHLELPTQQRKAGCRPGGVECEQYALELAVQLRHAPHQLAFEPADAVMRLVQLAHQLPHLTLCLRVGRRRRGGHGRFGLGHLAPLNLPEVRAAAAAKALVEELDDARALGRPAAEAIHVELADEGAQVGVLEVEGEHVAREAGRVNNAERVAGSAPGDVLIEALRAHDFVQLDEEGRDPVATALRVLHGQRQEHRATLRHACAVVIVEPEGGGGLAAAAVGEHGSARQ